MAHPLPILANRPQGLSKANNTVAFAGEIFVAAPRRSRLSVVSPGESGACGTGLGIDTPPKLRTRQRLEHDSFPITQEGRDNARIAATVEYGQDKKWFFIRRVHDQKIP
jgi:hypothetical protein